MKSPWRSAAAKPLHESEADIVQFRARENAAAVNPPATSTLPLGSNVAV